MLSLDLICVTPLWSGRTVLWHYYIFEKQFSADCARQMHVFNR